MGSAVPDDEIRSNFGFCVGVCAVLPLKLKIPSGLLQTGGVTDLIETASQRTYARCDHRRASSGMIRPANAIKMVT
jgi:hypothetical protein